MSTFSHRSGLLLRVIVIRKVAKSSKSANPIFAPRSKTPRPVRSSGESGFRRQCMIATARGVETTKRVQSSCGVLSLGTACLSKTLGVLATGWRQRSQFTCDERGSQDIQSLWLGCADGCPCCGVNWVVRQTGFSSSSIASFMGHR